MFNKPFKVKSNNQLKGTERKKLCEEVIKAFPSLKEEVQNLLRKKDVVSVMKVVTHSGQVVWIYCSGKTPIFFHIDMPILKLYPTIFVLWQYPDLISSFTMHQSIISNISNGADLMLPGVILDGPPGIHSYGKHPKGTVVSVNTKDNKAPVAVGLTALSSEDMYMSGGRGKCVEILHVIGDTLCQLDNTMKRPLIEHPTTESLQLENDNSTHSMSENATEKPVDEILENINKLDIECNESTNEEAVTEETIEEDIAKLPEKSPVEEMDELLEYCFLKACKTSIKRGNLPLLSSNLFKNHVLTACPSNQSLDIKHSSYKKLSIFLNSMEAKGVIKTSTAKGVQSIISIKTDHELIKTLNVLEDATTDQNELDATVITECFKVTTNVLPFVSKLGYEKGDILKRSEVRQIFHDYVKKEGLQEGSIFKLNGPLAGMFQTNERIMQMKMEDGFNKFLGKMTLMREITTGGTKVLQTGKMEPIQITIAHRNNGKKVTLVNNLEMYAIKLDKFSKECQGIGASSAVVEVPGQKSQNVLVQGNQVLYVYKLLTEKYRINKNYIRGLEHAPKKRKGPSKDGS